MKRSLLRWMSALLTLMVFTGIFYGCGAKQADQTAVQPQQAQTAEKGSKQDSDVLTSISLPIVKENLTLTCFMGLDAKISATLKSMSEIACYKELEKRTGIHTEFIHPPIGQEKEQFNLMIASRDLPDIIHWNWPTFPGGPAKAIEDGIILKLNDPIEKMAPNVKNMYAKYPEVRKQAILDDGTLFQYPSVRLRKDKNEWFKTYGPIIRTDWLNKVGLTPPKTVDELYTVLKAFREKDPNGNGDPTDEIPFTSNKGSGVKELAGAFGVTQDFYQENGKVKYGPIEPGYKNYLTTVSKWYKEGLIDTEYAINDGKAFDSKITGNKAGFFYSNLSGNLTRYVTLMKGKDPTFQLDGVTWPIGPAGKAYTTSADYNKLIPGGGKAITTANKHLKETVQLLDYVYSDEGTLLFNYGIEGESYVMKNGVPTYTDMIMNNPDKLTPDQAQARYCMASAGQEAMVKDQAYFEQFALSLPVQQKAQAGWDTADKSLLLPPITPTAAESARLATIMNEVTTYTEEMLTKFVMNQEPVENYDKFVKAIMGMGIEEAIKIQQEALNRYNKR